ncbi:MAG: LysR family transcriptional regulator [Hydrogenophaga sp.]|jgi:molybdate transport repressor ModE-like protein|uniref:LysR family transcriptional regulator n=1 Tax=Hydrogenophaga sp. TaxID=1904254 RepID=UPI002723BC47|nr:LysR family transcriptional regulator [Hydrogenophaga sp.]MDO9571308.1 LysR family transcriptional regulator [Hydrogenophaga sp.]MDP1894043.1 LysR family transcriptional regulator [Hydrogenophaga sp.]MDP2093577.1 LysR family transcriptional regulator [Hydrogenophaga sp.]MDP2219948.1 LysR family transcriptional regulator [Hydrogenophaga sp.]MDP3346113.1 LysR family transcriptional regulator [Hydrogenophaga sp.]
MASHTPRAALSPENLGLLEAVARLGSMAAAARELGMVPSALTYRVRQIEDALDVLLFDRSARRAQLTPAGAELLRSGQYLLNELDAVAQRVKRVATGWEPQFTIAADAIIARATLFELCETFYAEAAPTRLKLRAETLSGTLEALQSGQADLALGVPGELAQADIQTAPLGALDFVYAVAPHHPLAKAEHSLCDEELRVHRAVAVADSTQRGSGITHNLQPGQDVLTVPTMQHKLEAQLRGLGAGFLPLPLALPFINAGRLVVKTVQRPNCIIHLAYAWRQPRNSGDTGRALRWWLERLQHPTTRAALLNNHHQI